MSSPLKLIYIGAVALVIGWLLALFTVMRIVEPTFAVLFISYGLSAGGLIIGLVGVYGHFPFRRG